jgi:hypothetical protein
MLASAPQTMPARSASSETSGISPRTCSPETTATRPRQPRPGLSERQVRRLVAATRRLARRRWCTAIGGGYRFNALPLEVRQRVRVHRQRRWAGVRQSSLRFNPSVQPDLRSSRTSVLIKSLSSGSTEVGSAASTIRRLPCSSSGATCWIAAARYPEHGPDRCRRSPDRATRHQPVRRLVPERAAGRRGSSFAGHWRRCDQGERAFQASFEPRV